MSATIIDGKAIAQKLRDKIADAAADLKTKHGLVPGLAVVLVGNDPASEVYVRSKSKAVVDAGMRSFDHKLPQDVTQPDLHGADREAQCRQECAWHPGAAAVAETDRFAPPCSTLSIRQRTSTDFIRSMSDGSPPACRRSCHARRSAAVRLAKTVHPSLSGMDAVVVGRSNIVGKPLVQLLLAENATVTIAHSKTKDLPDLCRRADLLFAAVGRPEMVRGDWIKPGATVIDVGINRVPGEAGKTKLVGDVAFSEAKEIAGAITPVPGRCRADDHRLRYPQYAARCLRKRRPAGAGGVTYCLHRGTK